MGPETVGSAGKTRRAFARVPERRREIFPWFVRAKSGRLVGRRNGFRKDSAVRGVRDGVLVGE